MPLNNKDIYEWFSFGSKYKNDKDFWKWTVENDNYNEFKMIAEDLIELNIDEYKKIIKDRIDYMCYSQNELKAYKFVRDFISRKL